MLACLAAQFTHADLWQDLKTYTYGDTSAAPDQLDQLMLETPPGKTAEIEAKLIGIISAKDASVDGKRFACRMLQRIGTEKSVPALAALLNDEQLSHMARYALERMDYPSAKAALKPMARKLMSAEPTNPDVKKTALIANMIQKDPAKVATAIVTLLNGEPSNLRKGAARLLVTENSTELTKAVAGQLKGMPAPVQAETIMLLGLRGDKAALPAVSVLLNSKDAAVRTASIKALGRLGGANEVEPLLKQMQSAEYKAVASEALTKLDASGVDAVLAQQMQGESFKAEAIQVATLRNSQGVAPALLTLAAGSDAAVRHAAWDGLSTLASSNDMDAMMKLALAIKDPREKAFSEKCIKDFCGQAADSEKCMQVVIPYYGQANGSTKLFILDIAAKAGSQNALELAEDALKSSDKELYGKAVRSLAAWPNTKASPTLLELAENAKEETIRILALRGYIQTAALESSGGKRLKMYEEATKLATRIEEKRLIVSGLGASKNNKAVDLMVQFLDDAAVRSEAEAAALQLAKDLGKKKPDEARILADKIIAVSDDKKNINKAKSISENAGKKKKK